ncbi:MAG: TetR/AcrR family transcriptional regulator [Bacteroidota bacterium]
MTRKEREKELRKHEITKAALKLFSQKGYKATTLDEIAEESEFGKGTIYNYFTSKEDIYREIIFSTLELHKKLIYTIDQEKDNLYDFILELNNQLIRFSLNNREAFLLFIFTEMHLSHSNSPEIMKIMDDHQNLMNDFFINKAEEAIKRKEIRKIDPQRTIRIYRGIVSNYLYELLMKDRLNEDDIDYEAEFIADIIFNGIIAK